MERSISASPMPIPRKTSCSATWAWASSCRADIAPACGLRCAHPKRAAETFRHRVSCFCRQPLHPVIEVDDHAGGEADDDIHRNADLQEVVEAVIAGAIDQRVGLV